MSNRFGSDVKFGGINVRESYSGKLIGGLYLARVLFELQKMQYSLNILFK